MTIKQGLDSVEEVKRLMSYDSIRITNRDRENVNNVLLTLNHFLDSKDDPVRELLETLILAYMKDIAGRYDEDNALTPEFIKRFIAAKLDFIFAVGKEHYLDALTKQISMNGFVRTNNPKVFDAEPMIKKEISTLVLDMIQYNRNNYDHRTNSDRG